MKSKIHQPQKNKLLRVSKKLLITAILAVFTSAYSQNHELGKVTIEELKEKVCPSDTSAVAAVLFNVGKISYSYSQSKGGFELLTEITTKIKIYKKEGYDFANQSFRYYTDDGGNSENINISKAVTYNLVDGKVEKVKLKSDGEFDEKVTKLWSRKKITMPNVREGSIIEYKIEIRSPYVRDIPDWNFQKSIPVNFSEFTTYIPEYYFFNVRYKGFITPIIKQEKLSNTITLTSKERDESKNARPTTFSSENINYYDLKTKYTLENIPALKEEAFVNNIENYRVTVLHELSGEKFPNSFFENFSTDWETVIKRIYENEKFGEELKKTAYFEKDLDAVMKESSAQEDRVILIFNFVKSRMNWNEIYGIYCDDGVKKAYQDKKGNAAEINIMLTAMLRYAGFDANPILVSTRYNGISLFPSRTSFNNVICGVELQNQVVLLDATSKFSLPNILPIQDLNWTGRIIRKNETSNEINLMPRTNSKDIVNILATINNEGEVSGKIRDQYFDYNAFVFRVKNNAITKESYIEKLEKRHQGLEIGEYEVQNSTDLSEPIVENYSFTSTNSVEIIGDKMYLSPFLFFTLTENPFKQEKREYPIDFVFPNQDKFNISLTIPEGYVVETLPQPKAVTMPEELANFKYNISNNGNQIQILYTLDINQAIVGSEYYEALKNFFKEIVNKQTEKIVLKKR